MPTAKPSVLESSCFELEIGTEKLKRSKLPCIDQILTELIQAGGKTSTKFILFGIRKNCHSRGRNLLLSLFMKRVIKITVVFMVEYHCYQLDTKFYPPLFSHS
jgi:hypothetical protein